MPELETHSLSLSRTLSCLLISDTTAYTGKAEAAAVAAGSAAKLVHGLLQAYLASSAQQLAHVQANHNRLITHTASKFASLRNATVHPDHVHGGGGSGGEGDGASSRLVSTGTLLRLQQEARVFSEAAHVRGV